MSWGQNTILPSWRSGQAIHAVWAVVLGMTLLTAWPGAALAGGGGGGSGAGKAMSAVAGGGPDPDATGAEQLEADLKNAFRRPEMPSEEDMQEFERKMMGMSSEKYGAFRKKYERQGGFGATQMSFQKWLNHNYSRAYWSQRAGEQEGAEAGFQLATVYHPNVERTLKTADKAGQVSQFGLSFVPGVGTATGITLDATRGFADTYKQNMESGKSQSEAITQGLKSGGATGLLSAFLNKFGAGEVTNADKHFKNAGRYAKVAQYGKSGAMRGVAGTKATTAFTKGLGAKTLDKTVDVLAGDQIQAHNAAKQPVRR